MAEETNEGSGARGSGVRSGRVFFNEKKGRIEFYDENNTLVRIDGDVRDRAIADGQFGTVYVDINGNDKVFFGPKTSGLVETYFLGKLQCNLTGGTIDGGTYSFYQLRIRLYHRFSVQFPDFQLLHNWWGQEHNLSPDDSVTEQTLTRLQTVPGIQTTGGVAATTGGGYLNDGISRGVGELVFARGVTDANDPTNPNTEFVEWAQNITWVSGTVVIPPQTLWLIVMLFYLNQELPIITNSPTYAQGGGGGVLTERINLYL